MKFGNKVKIKEWAVVALYTSAWIEMIACELQYSNSYVALYTSAWIEITLIGIIVNGASGRTLHECVD